MGVSVCLQVSGLNLSNPLVLQTLERFDDVLFGVESGITTMTIHIEDGRDIVSTVLERARKLANLVKGAAVTRVHPDLVSASDISSRVGISREAVRKWVTSIDGDFPKPLGVVSQDSRVWRWMDVAAWLRDAKGIETDEDLPSPDVVAHIDACLSKVPDRTTYNWLRTSATVEDLQLEVPAGRSARIHYAFGTHGISVKVAHSVS